MIKVFPLITTLLLSSLVNPNRAPFIKMLRPPSSSSSASFSFISDDNHSGQEEQYYNYFYSPTYGPFLLGCSNVNVSFRYRLNIPSQYIIERVRFFRDNEVVFSQTHASKYYERGSLLDVYFTIPVGDYLTHRGLTIKFEIIKKDIYEELYSQSQTFYPLTKLDVSYIELKQGVYESKNLGFYGDERQMRSAIERYDFRSIGDYFDIDYYYRLDLKNLSFRYDSIFPLKYETVNLRFEDRNNLFPYYSHDVSKNVVIPLKLENEGAKVKLAFKKTFYINKRTLQISDTYRSGFVMTSDFYFPINGKKKFNNKTIYLDIDGLGQSQLTTSIPIRYLVDKSLIGVCHDGVHCIGGGSR